MKKNLISKKDYFQSKNVREEDKSKKKKKKRSKLSHVKTKGDKNLSIEDKENKNLEYLVLNCNGFGSNKNSSYTIIINPKAPQLKVYLSDRKEVDETDSST